jgi:4-carboxymuconolactone decarboxylase
MTNNQSKSLEKGRELLKKIAPDTEEVLKHRYDNFLPKFSESVVDMSYGQIYSREGLELKTRFLLTIGALTAQGAYSLPQLEIHIKNALNSGVKEREICEAIFQMSLYGGFPAMINALNIALIVFLENEKL